MKKKNTETMIIEALNEDRVEVFYQPIYSTGRKDLQQQRLLSESVQEMEKLYHRENL